MWDINKIADISPLAIQKRLPFAASISEVHNFIGNFTLTPSALPTTIRSKFLMQALIKELLIVEKTVYKEGKVLVPDYIKRISASPVESCLMMLDGTVMSDYTVIQDNNEDIAVCIQIHPHQQTITGTCSLDFGLNEKQSIHLKSQRLLHIPTPTAQPLHIILDIQQGITACRKNVALHIPYTPVGLIIDTRDNDILIKSTIEKSKEYILDWLQTFDITVSES
jgi:hypothetical protein